MHLKQSSGEQGRGQVLSHMGHDLGFPGLWQQERLPTRAASAPEEGLSFHLRARAPSAWLTLPSLGWSGHFPVMVARASLRAGTVLCPIR